MQAYKFDIRITKDGIISLPFVPTLFDKEVGIIILPKTETGEAKHKITPSEFVRKWSGVIPSQNIIKLLITTGAHPCGSRIGSNQ
jgi:hypothetical protein